MARRSHRKGHGTGTRDYNLLAEINAMPRRDSLPGGNAGTVVTTRVYGSGVPGVSIEDQRSDELKFWDEHYEDLKKRMAANRTADQAKAAQSRREVAALKKRIAKATALGVPLADDTAAKSQAEQKETPAPAAPSEPGKKPEPERKPPSGPTNGQRQVRTQPSAPLAPRNPRPAAPETVVGTVGRFGGTGSATDTHVRVDGAPLDARNTGAQAALGKMQAEHLKAGEIRAAEERKDAQSAAQTSDVDRLHSREVARFQQEKNRQELSDARAQFREQQRAALMEKRYKNRSFRDAEDWKNLGTLREGEQMLDEKTYDEKVGDLVDRAKRLRSAAGRAGLGLTDLQDMDMVFKTVGKLPTEKREDGSVKYGGNLTPAQIEALGKRIGGFEANARASRARTAARVEAINRQTADAYREQYGLQGFSDEDVLRFHERRRGQAVGKALDTIAAIGTPKDADGVRGYEGAWDVIRRNADITGALNRALPDQAAKDRFMDDIAAITGEDAAARREDFRRSTIIAQLNKERQTPAQPEQPAEPEPIVEQPQPAQPAKPQQSESGLLPKRKKPEEETHAALFAGTALRPRARR